MESETLYRAAVELMEKLRERSETADWIYSVRDSEGDSLNMSKLINCELGPRQPWRFIK